MNKFEEEGNRSFGSYMDDSDGSGVSRSSGISRTNSNQSGFSADKSDSNSGGSDKFTGAETKYVNRSKFLMYVALAIAAAAVTSVAYIQLRDDEEATMKAEFAAYSREILKQAQANSVKMFEDLWDLSKSITSHTLDAEMTWPNCTVPHFDIRAREKKPQTKIPFRDPPGEFVGFAPFVTPETQTGWEAYAVEHQDWVAQDYNYRGHGWNDTTPMPIPPTIHRYNDSEPVRDFEEDMFDYMIPLWQLSPVRKDTSIINLDLASIPVMAHLLWDVKVKKVEQYSRVMNFDTLALLHGEEHIDRNDHPRGTIYQPVFEDFRENSEVVGFMIGSLSWDNVFKDVRFEGGASLLVEIEGTCNAVFTYKVTSSEIVFLGYGQSLRDPKYDKYKETADMLTPKGSRPGYPPVEHTHRDTDASHGQSHCTYVMNTYPTEQFEAVYKTHEPIIYSIVIGCVFVFTAFVFWFYDFMVQHRQGKLMLTAIRTNAIVSSLFPKDVQKRMMEEIKQKELDQKNGKRANAVSKFLNEEEYNDKKGAPIAELFPSATIMFGDIVGFTAWSSTREPAQVFTLLETLYGAFDKLANKRRVFKVETIGDCYVAVAGLPERRKDHAPVMARFARDCLDQLRELVLSLETSLGPDTCDLGMRIGLHSGPVTAGVLRGERARFQLFGDSVNTTARIETTGKKNCIHLSEQTAKLLIDAGKQHWTVPREDEVEAKGKGKLTTFWLIGGNSDGASSHFASNEGSTSSSDDLDTGGSAHISNRAPTVDERLVEWNVDNLSKLLRQIQARRNATKSTTTKPVNLKSLEKMFSEGQVALDEVEDIIRLPVFDANTYTECAEEAESVELGREVVSELYKFVESIAQMYNSNPFHNFAHASHVTMSVTKLLSRIVAPSDDGVDHAYGIASDPLTQFSVILSAIIHDADHLGIPNSQLIKEGNTLASMYENKSIAEQNSFHLVWDLLMEDSFVNLRAAVYSDEDELRRFRQLMVNSVLATDIMDKGLGAARKARWNKAFSDETSISESPDVVTNRKATIVIEHLIQASDVSHTMQHWHIYLKWNERLFMEMYKAYKEGRAEKDPSEGWYAGEIGFFDFYVIPLAKKLKDCSVFGVSSDEYLNYAEQNRAEWEAKGPQQVEMYLEKYGDIDRQTVKSGKPKPDKRESPVTEDSYSSSSASPSSASQEIEEVKQTFSSPKGAYSPEPFLWRGMMVCEC